MSFVTTITDFENGYEITTGLQGSSICDEAINTALEIASDRGKPVVLNDDDGEWVVYPDGSVIEVDIVMARQYCCDC